MGIKKMWARFAERLQPVSDQGTNGISKEKATINQRSNNKSVQNPYSDVNTDNVRTLEEYISLYNNILRKLKINALCEGRDMDYREIVSVYEALLSKCGADKKYLIETLTFYFVSTIYYYTDWYVWEPFFAALYVICQKYEISYMETIENSNCWRHKIDFHVFIQVCEVAKMYHLDTTKASKDIAEIWEKYFDTLCINSYRDEGYVNLRKADDEWHHNWGEFLYNRLSAFDPTVADRWNYIYVDAREISRYYPELTALAYRYLILAYMYSLKYEYDEEDIKEYNLIFRQYMQHVMDYAEYQNIEFEFAEYWQKILSKIFILFDGNTLTLAIEMLHKVGHIPLETMHEYIINQTLYFLNGSNSIKREDVKLGYEPCYWVNEMSFVARLNILHRLLSNKIVYEVVAYENYSIIQTFNYGE